LLNGIAELEQKANERYGVGGRPNGLFVRDDITGPDDPRLGGRFQVVRSDWQHPEQENESPSGDQIFGLMNGLYGIVRFSGDDVLIGRARAISSRLFDYARRTFFILRLPNGNATQRGADVRWLASLLHGLNMVITGEDHFSECRVEVGILRLPLNGIATFWDDSDTPATIAQSTGQTIHVPVINKNIELNSFALHIMLMALSPSEVWSQDELESVALKANHHLAVLLYCQAHGKHPAAFDAPVIDQILDACPTEGPHADLSSTTGWQHDNRWIRCTNIFDPNDGQEAFNGLDWLLLHNYRWLVFPSR
jgi:hypothetical protein